MNSNKYEIEKNTIKWEKINLGKKYEKSIIWEKIENNKDNFLPI